MLGETQVLSIVDIVREVSAEEIMPRFRNLEAGDISAKTSPQDLVTIADQRAEVALTQKIRSLLPCAAIIGEEAVAADPKVMSKIGEAAMTVILDPIDGTWNYAHGIATFGVILAVRSGPETIFGLIYDPVLDDWALASKGAGAWFDTTRHSTRIPLRTSSKVDLRDFNGFVPLRAFPENRQFDIDIAQRRLGQVQTLRCSAHEYRLLAQGMMDFQLSSALKPWDHAAGQLIHTEAGGISRLLDGRAYSATCDKGYMLSAPGEESWQNLNEYFSQALS